MTTKSAAEVERELTIAEAIEVVCDAAAIRALSLEHSPAHSAEILEAIEIVRAIF